MYSVTVRGHFMIAHSLTGAVFGPARNLHGATYVANVTFRRPTLDENAIVVDMGRAGAALAQVLDGLNFRNLDDDPDFAGKNTTTEVLARDVFERMAARIAAGDLGPGSDGLVSMAVSLEESPVARAAYEAPL